MASNNPVQHIDVCGVKKFTRKGLTFEQKVHIIHRLNHGTKQRELAASYGVARSTISGILKQKDIILERNKILQEKHPKKQSKRFSAAEDSTMEKILYKWFCQNIQAGIPTTGNLLQENALRIHESLFGKSDFTASSGWLHKFKTRYNIRKITKQSEQLSTDTEESADIVEQSIETFIKEEGFDMDHIYNADETSLFWKLLPNDTLLNLQNDASDCQNTNERVNLMVCANVSGKHKLPLLMVGKCNNPKCLEGLSVLPVYYYHEKNNFVDKQIFLQWYTNVFLPNVKNKKQNETEKCLLLLERRPFWPSEEELNAIDSTCIVKYNPQSDPALILPMNRQVITSLKRLYRKAYLRHFLANDKLIERWSLLKCMQTLSVAWESVKENTLSDSWKNMFGLDVEIKEDDDILEIAQMASCAIQAPVSVGKTNKWLTIDENVSASKILINEKSPSSTDEAIKTEDIPNDDVERIPTTLKTSDEEEDDAGTTQVSAKEAYHGAGQLYNWLMTRPNNTPQSLLQIGKLQEDIANIIAQDKMRE